MHYAQNAETLMLKPVTHIVTTVLSRLKGHRTGLPVQLSYTVYYFLKMKYIRYTKIRGNPISRL